MFHPALPNTRNKFLEFDFADVSYFWLMIVTLNLPDQNANKMHKTVTSYKKVSFTNIIFKILLSY